MTAPPDTDSLIRLHDAARAEAVRLREEAVDDFWRGANEVLLRGMSQAQRAAVRLALRLRHHAARSEAAPPARA